MADFVSGSVVRIVPPDETLVRVVPVAGPQGPPATASVHVQTTPAASVTIQHNKNRLPTVELWSNGQQIFTEINATITQINLVFSTPTAFTAIIS